MSTDKTLADVQPGGRVRLGNLAERARFEAWVKNHVSSLARAADGAYASNLTHALWCAWQAALSAQPSPGGQGDARLLADVVERIATAKALGYEDDIGVGIGLLQCVRSALAARQPVGEPVGEGWSGWATQYPGMMPKLYGAREIAELNYHPDEGQRLIFLTEQPAQAVDLVQFREPVECWVRSISIIADNEQEDAEERRAARDLIRRGDWLLALIDSQAVSNG
jgi:hypothetical protein